ncbi:FtsX-like permease family protein [bacterium]|nr:MAG: FtsX-like permease family protein [bacterium]
MNFISVIKLVFRTLRARKGRAVLTILGITIGVAGVITIIALGAGAQSLVLGQVTKLGSNLLNVMPGMSNEKGPPTQIFGVVVTTLTSDDAAAISDTSRVPHALAVAGAVRGNETVIWRDKSVDTSFVGTGYSYPQVLAFTMDQGRFFDQREDQGDANVIVLGSAVKDELFGSSGVDPVGQVVKIKNVPFRVIGVVASRGSAFFQNMDDQVFIPVKIAQTQLLGIHYLQAIYVKVDASKNIQLTIDDIKLTLTERHHIKRPEDVDFTVRNIADAVSILTTITSALRLFLVSMAAISLVVGGVGILNIMLITVAERTREIGLRKAVGATNAAVRNQFLLESGALTLIGGLAGIVAGTAMSYLAAVAVRYAGYDWAFVISPLSVVLAVGVSILTGLIFGLYPAFKASKLDPIEALRYE